MGIAPTKDEKIIKKAYREKALNYHPDRNPSPEANRQFILITDAYEIIIQSIKKSQSAETVVKTKGKQYSFDQFSQSRKKTNEEIFKERLRRAQKRYEYLRKKEEEENEKYYQLISRGASWRYFKVVMVGCTLMSLLFFFDALLLPSRWEKDTVQKGSRVLHYSGVFYNKIIPIKTKNGHRAWVKSSVYNVMEHNPNVYIEKTYFFRDIKSIWVWSRYVWIKTKSDFSVIGTFPIVPLFLLIPLITYFIKGRTLTYSLLFNVSLYIFGITLILLLILNDRWAHILTFGML